MICQYVIPAAYGRQRPTNEGTVEKFVGDAAMAVFGLPQLVTRASESRAHVSELGDDLLQRVRSLLAESGAQ